MDKQGHINGCGFLFYLVLGGLGYCAVWMKPIPPDPLFLLIIQFKSAPIKTLLNYDLLHMGKLR